MNILPAATHIATDQMSTKPWAAPTKPWAAPLPFRLLFGLRTLVLVASTRGEVLLLLRSSWRPRGSSPISLCRTLRRSL